MQNSSLTLIVGLLIASAATVTASVNFNFTDIGTDFSITGTLTAEVNPNGSFTATSGTGLWGTGLYEGQLLTLVSNPNAPFETSNDFFFYDNQLFPSANPTLNGAGLLFVFSDVSLNNYQANIFGNSPGSYTTWVKNTEDQSDALFAQSTFTLTAVPEPGNWISGLALLSMAGVVRRRRQT